MLLFSNPIVYAMFSARGGWKGHLLLGGVTLGALVLVDAAVIGFGQTNWARGLATWNNVLLFLQSLLLLVTTFPAVSNAIRNDAKSGMHDSLRLMRLSPSAVVAGYLLGGLVQGLTIFVPCFLVGMVNTLLAQGDPGRYLAVSLTVVMLLPMLLMVSAFSSLVFRLPALAFVVGCIAAPFGVAVSQVVPPLALLTGSVVGRQSVLGGSGRIDVTLVLTLATHLAVAAILFAACARKFERPRRPAFTPALGLIVVAGTALASFIALLSWEGLAPFSADGPYVADIAGTLVLQTLVALVPVVAAASEVARERARAVLLPDTVPSGGVEIPAADAPRTRRLSATRELWLTVLVAALVATGGAFLDSQAVGKIPQVPLRLVLSFGQLFVYLAGVAIVHRFAAVWMSKPAVLTTILVLGWQLVPLLALAWATPTGPGAPSVAGFVAALSPGGLLFETWVDPGAWASETGRAPLPTMWLAAAISLQAAVVLLLAGVLRLRPVRGRPAALKATPPPLPVSQAVPLSPPLPSDPPSA